MGTSGDVQYIGVFNINKRVLSTSSPHHRQTRIINKCFLMCYLMRLPQFRVEFRVFLALFLVRFSGVFRGYFLLENDYLKHICTVLCSLLFLTDFLPSFP